MILAAVSIPGSAWSWVALAAAVVLVPLAWTALGPARAETRTFAIALALRTFGVGLLLLCLLDPQWTSPRAVSGANLFAILADNSQGLQVTDTGAEATRGEEMRTRLVAADTSWMPALADEFQLRSYVFDRGLQRVAGFTRLDFSGDRTDLGAALRQLRERTAGRPLAGVLLFTDGNATDLDEASFDPTGLPPVYPVVVGQSGLRDIRLDHATVRQTAFDDAPVTVRADVSGTSIGDREVEVAVARIDESTDLATSEVPAPARVRLRPDGATTSATFSWRPSGSGVQFFEIGVTSPREPLAEATTLNNRRLFAIDRGRPAYRILYVGGRPAWEFKFLNRALLEDPQLQMVGLLRVARREPKFEFKGRAGESSNPMFRGFEAEAEAAPRYDQPVLVRVNARDERELHDGFPKTAEELFTYDAVILDDIEIAFFTLEQQSLLRRFAADRGGGLLVLGGADSLESGGYADSPLAAALPVYLDRRAAVLPQGALRWSLTREGWVEPWMRVRQNETDERARQQSLPALFVAHGLDQLKPGATALALVEDEEGHTFPALAAQTFGSGRVACLMAGDLWRWALRDETGQADLARTWRQIARWLVTEVPTQVALTARSQPDGSVRLQVTARDRSYRPLDHAQVRVTVERLESSETEGGFESVTLPAEPSADVAGRFLTTFAGRDAGAYLARAEVQLPSGEVVGRAEAGWVIDPAADEFRSLEPNHLLLETIARKTGGAMVSWDGLDDFVASLPSRAAPVQEFRAQPLWHSSWVFAVVLACFGAEWLWRRWKGLV